MTCGSSDSPALTLETSGRGGTEPRLHLTQEAWSCAPPPPPALHGELTAPSISGAGLRGVGGPPGEEVNGARCSLFTPRLPRGCLAGERPTLQGWREADLVSPRWPLGVGLPSFRKRDRRWAQAALWASQPPVPSSCQAGRLAGGSLLWLQFPALPSARVRVFSGCGFEDMQTVLLH